MMDMVYLQRCLKEAQQEKKEGSQIWYVHGFRIKVSWKEVPNWGTNPKKLAYRTNWYVNGAKVSAKSLHRIVFGQRLS